MSGFYEQYLRNVAIEACVSRGVAFSVNDDGTCDTNDYQGTITVYPFDEGGLRELLWNLEMEPPEMPSGEEVRDAALSVLDVSLTALMRDRFLDLYRTSPVLAIAVLTAEAADDRA